MATAPAAAIVTPSQLGNGLTAARDIARGEVVLEEAPCFLVVDEPALWPVEPGLEEAVRWAIARACSGSCGS